ncbi:YolD-like family protein [Paenibacillus larvae]|uniref:YolD-like protein n=4 Tax=Paenibacillus larvae TaxID=1464 RepID=V9W8L7_9BACL|nr:YolD-like family protein [Paenibacillus larvae]AHD06040.1 hypothetical protein ERIC2_c22470 [Paenibacillus larvae subsp. larvae DSM 25430]AQR76466.1 hypothetical protein BXP28_02830 [Paenibacillus larvae subsp. larvae]AQT83709.1 hypothetical protein B1222_03655 [Paenibacillus larvae subsp. pulvifaciens]AQZ48857.1 hypothetical protein B5S25_22000 [Paenibacillus larvae subsp. pulvifaciens]AVF22694.1 YolD-like protein [Paenibacillus larvae subsp. larvae]
MSKKLTGNGLWESSRMMLPEHREQLLEQRRELKKHAKPLLDEQRLEELSTILNYALATKHKVRFTVYDVYEDQHIAGVLIKYDPLTRSLGVISEANKAMHIMLENIIDVRLE